MIVDNIIKNKFVYKIICLRFYRILGVRGKLRISWYGLKDL